MTTPSKVSHATGRPRPRRKNKSVSKYQTTQLTSAMIEAHARRQAFKEIQDFMDDHTEAERRIVGHLVPWNDPVGGIKEIRRLLGESIAKCKVIQFPVGGKRGVQVAKEA